jgi:lysophospholipase L1-like esterase
MTADSPRADELLNNQTIAQYNTILRNICRERGWYYVDAALAMTDEYGFLRADYSGDKAMGIHLNFSGTEAWANYLLTHVPSALKDLQAAETQDDGTGSANEGE